VLEYRLSTSNPGKLRAISCRIRLIPGAGVMQAIGIRVSFVAMTGVVSITKTSIESAACI
jgi:hypothetical protein